MVVLLDANLSWRLVEPLKSNFKEVYHVDNIGLSKPPKDIEIWKYASEKNAIIISNDSDFYKFSIINGFPPKVVLLRTGNQSNNFLLKLIIKHKDDIVNLYKSKEYGLLEII